jgi:RNA polymerase sigma-70 factor (ECF subfamily)
MKWAACETVDTVSDDEHFEALARQLVDPLRRFLARRTDAETAEDVLADTLLVCWRRRDDIPDEPLPWAYGVARNCLANALRSGRRQERVAAKVAAVDPPQEVEPAPGDRDDDLAEALAALPETDAELLRLWAWEQLTPAEIAEALEITANAASVRLHRAKEKLRAELDARLGKKGADAGHEESREGRRP